MSTQSVWTYCLNSDNQPIRNTSCYSESMTDKIVLDVLPLFVEWYVGIRKPHIHYQSESPIYTINLKAPYALSIWKPHMHYQSESPIYTINLKAPYALSIWKPHIHYQSESPICTTNLKAPYTLSISHHNLLPV